MLNNISQSITLRYGSATFINFLSLVQNISQCELTAAAKYNASGAFRLLSARNDVAKSKTERSKSINSQAEKKASSNFN